MGISATVLAHNEAHRIAGCLDSIRWVDEIVVVVDSQTTDATAEVARRYTDRVLSRPLQSFSDQHRWADEQCAGEWILSVDCDEIVTEALREEIRRELAAPRCDAYRIPHLDYMFGKWIRHGGWYPQYHTRLYRRGSSQWQNDVHERVQVRGTIGRLRQPLLHFSHARVEDWINKMARYTSVEARNLYDAGQRTNLLRLLFEPPLYFGYKWIVKQGFRDGMHVFVLATLMGCYRLLRNLKLWDLQQSARGPRESKECPPSMSRS